MWTAITDHRRDVFEVTLAQVRQILTGEIDNWTALGGRDLALSAFVEAHDVAPLAETLGVMANELRASQLTDAAAVEEAVAGKAGGFGLVRMDALRLDVMALVVGGHDPYRDPAATAPIQTAGVLPEIDPVVLVSAGEYLPVRCTNAALEATGDFGAAFAGIRPLTRSADIAVIGMDAPLTDLSTPTPCPSSGTTFTLQGSSKSIAAMADAGIDVAFPIGNHMLDCWNKCELYAGLVDTLKRLRTAGIMTTGAGASLAEARRPATLTIGSGKDRMRIAFLGYDNVSPANWATDTHAGTAPLTTETIVEDVRAARQQADIVVVGLSWGDEYQLVPTATQQATARAATAAGASVILGNGPHTTQGVDHRDGHLIAYALGNYLFDQDFAPAMSESLLVEASFQRGRLVGYRARPIVTLGDDSGRRALYRPVLLDPASPRGRLMLDRVAYATDLLP